MARTNLGKQVLMIAALVAGTAVTAQAQVLSGPGTPATVAISASKAEFITLTLSASTLTNTDIATSPNLGNITATMGWTLSPSRGAVKLVGWFGSTTALTDGAGNNVASGDFLGACTATSLSGGTCSSTPAAFSGASDAALGSTAGASLLLWQSPAITGTTRNQSGVTAALNFQLNSAAVAALPAGTYTGTLNLRAYAQ